MSKKIKKKSNGIQRSEIPYKDRLMVHQFANIAQHRDHSAIVANKIGMVALNDLKGMGYIQLTRWGLLYNSLNEEFYADPEYQEAKLDERLRKMGFVVEDGRVIIAEDENGAIVPTSTLVLCPEILFIREQLSAADQFAQVAEEAVELAHAAMKMRRILDGTNPARVPKKEALKNILEEIADVSLVINMLGYNSSRNEVTCREIMAAKVDRWADALDWGAEG